MKNRLLGMIAAASVAIMLSGCGAGSSLASLGDSILGPPTPTVQAPIANSVAAAENLFTATDKALKAAVVARSISVDEATRLGNVETRVYGALVGLRAGVPAGKDVTALYDAYNGAFGDFYKDLVADGISVPIPATAVPAGAGT